MSKTRCDEWYLGDNCKKFVREIEFVYDTYVNNIKDMYDTPDYEAEKYKDYLEKNPQELESSSIDSAMEEILIKSNERYDFVLNMKYRFLAIFIDLIYQMLEQFIISICKFQQDYHSYDPKINNLQFQNLHQCAITIFSEYDFNFETKKEYAKINELRLLQNVLKHSEGKSKEELAKKRPEYFVNKNYALTIYKNTIIDATLNISNDDLKEYVIAIKEFLKIFPDKLIHEYNC